MNIIAGILIGVLSKTWIFCLLTPFIWGLIHCIYGYILKLHDNLMVASTTAGHPIISYYFARYTTGSLTSLLFSFITYLVKKYLF